MTLLTIASEEGFVDARITGDSDDAFHLNGRNGWSFCNMPQTALDTIRKLKVGSSKSILLRLCAGIDWTLGNIDLKSSTPLTAS
jgi:hypothetical protein